MDEQVKLTREEIKARRAAMKAAAAACYGKPKRDKRNWVERQVDICEEDA
jgi:hypothetical protein